VRLLAQGFQTLFAVASGIVLARLLTPTDFGVYAMAFTLIGFVSWFRDFGLPLALTQSEELTDSAARAIFFTGIKLTAGVIGFVALMAPVAAAFYGEPRVRSVVLTMGIGVLALGFAIVPEGVLIRRMRFGALATIDTVAGLAGTGIAITAAVLGAGYWALVFQYLAMTLIRSAGICLVSDWRYLRSRADSDDAAAARAMLRYGRDLTGARIVRYFGMNTDRILIGRFHESAALGLYDNSLRWSRYPFLQVFLPLQNVIVSTLSRVRGDAPRYRNAFRRGTLPIYSVIVPILAYVIVDAPSLVLALLGDQWLAAVPLFRLLAMASAGQALRRATSWLYLSEGRTGRQLRWNGIAALVQVLAVVVGLQWGVVGVAIGFALASWVLVLPDILYCTRGSILDARDFSPIVWRPLVAALFAAGLLLVVWPELLAHVPAATTEGEALRHLLLRSPVFLAAYLLVWVGLPGGRAALRDVLELATILATASTASTASTGTGARGGKARATDQAAP